MAALDIQNIIRSARISQVQWKKTSLHDRLEILKHTRNLLALHGESLAEKAAAANRSVAEIIASEFIPLGDAFRFIERNAKKILSPKHVGLWGRPSWLTGIKQEIHREPFGVILVIAPVNYPFLLSGVQILHALAAGNAVLVKPGLGGTDAVTSIANLFWQAGIDHDLLQILPESIESSQSALQAGLDKVFFTGSAETGRKILQTLAPQLIPATVELSGSDCVIVRDDADLNLASRALLFGMKLNESQTCIAPRRVLVSKNLKPKLEKTLSEQLKPWTAQKISKQTEGRLIPLLQEALEKGAKLLSGSLPPFKDKQAPWILTDVQPSASILREDLFAPVLSLVSVENEQEAIQLANQSPYGLGASIFTQDMERAHEIGKQIETGSVTINDIIAPTADPRVPFGGRKQSGFGCTRGAEGLLEMTQIKVVSTHTGNMYLHLDPEKPEDREFFLNYFVAANSTSCSTRLRALIKVSRMMLRKLLRSSS